MPLHCRRGGSGAAAEGNGGREEGGAAEGLLQLRVGGVCAASPAISRCDVRGIAPSSGTTCTPSSKYRGREAPFERAGWHIIGLPELMRETRESRYKM